MKSFSAFVPFCALSLQLQPALAFWRMSCSVSQTSRIDPILSPGTISGHVHKFAGGNNVDQFSTHDTLQGSTCSTCEVQSDKSAYWTPQLYYQYSNGTIVEVENDGMTVYYVGRGGTPSNTVPFPQGFKMISGNSLLRHYDTQNLTYMDTRPIADRVSFRCINEANNIPETHYINDTNCVNGLRAQINFQSCWDGVNLYKEGNTHVAYLSGIDYGVCPPTHPVPIPGLFYEVLYWSNRIDQSQGGRFVFSNGDTTGYGFHGDFLNGWDQNVQTQAVQDCLYNSGDSSGVVSACSALASSDNTNFPRICPESAEVMPEAIKGVLPSDQLPGCNPITSGPSDASQVVCALNSTTPVTGQSPSPTQSGTVSTTVIVSTSSTTLATSTVVMTTESTSTDFTTLTDSSAISTSSTLLSSSQESTLSTSSISATDSSTDLITVTTGISSGFISTETLTTMLTQTWTRSGHPWDSQSFSGFSRSYTGHYGDPQSLGGVFVTVSSSQSAESASSTGDCTAVNNSTATVTVTVTVGESTADLGTNTDVPTSTGSVALATLLITTTETIILDTTTSVPSDTSVASIELSSTTLPLNAATETDVITTTIATGPQVTASPSSLPWSVYISHMPVHSSWANFSAPWSNYSHPTAFPWTPTTSASSSASSLASSIPVNQSSSIEVSATSSSTVDQTSTVAITDTSVPASSTPFYTGTSISGTMTTLVTVFVPVSAISTDSTSTASSTTSTLIVESAAPMLEKREAENQRLKAYVTFKLRGREVIMERSA